MFVGILRMRFVSSAITVVLIATVITGCATGGNPKPNPYPSGAENNAAIKALHAELLNVREEKRQFEKASMPGAQGFFESGEFSLDSIRAMSSAERREKVDSLIGRSIELWGEISQRIESELDSAITREFGPRQPVQNEQVALEALDSEGNVIEVPVTVEIRPLRRISDAGNAARLPVVLGPGRPALTGYDGLPVRIVSTEMDSFRRIYTGQSADAIAMEARSLVMLKGGEWMAASGNERVANTIAVRGLDMDLGLGTNGNVTYDDTMYVVLEGGGNATKVIEYRATTESSSTKHGVGRLTASQVTYQRGLHKGRDPAFRLKGDRAEGTRAGKTGTYDILGANLHSAYSSKRFDSKTPLSPNVSLGCQVVATSKSSFESNMVNYLKREGIGEFLYTIIEDEELQIFERNLRESSVNSVLVHIIDRTSM
jgi:hypothetical protein